MPDHTGRLILIPTPLGKTPENNTIPEFVLQEVRLLRVLIVENIQTAQRFLRWVGHTVPDYEIRFFELNRHTKDSEIINFIQPMLQGNDVGLLSEAGYPAVADPGAEVVRLAHQNGIPVVPSTGPSSILLALAASGFNGQQFAFHGYLPIDGTRRKDVLLRLENESQKTGITQIFMEAPHRNMALLEDALATLSPETWLCSATDLTFPSEEIHSSSLATWRDRPLPELGKRPTVFVLSSRNDTRQRKKKEAQKKFRRK